MGVNRDLKKATESYWGGKISQKELLAEGKRLRGEHWKIQKESGIDIIPSNDFSYYDHVLDHIQLFGVRRHRPCGACNWMLIGVAGHTREVRKVQPRPNR